ncbi:MAG: hypothetical protein AB7E77_11115 [Desulfobulbus sp.]
MYPPALFHTWYNGTPAEKLSQAQLLFERFRDGRLIEASLSRELGQLQRECQGLSDQMEAMALGHLCSGCAARPGGGCCSAYMADNTDSLQILINLLLGVRVSRREPEDSECCFLGPTGCLFRAKPIFCLNYNCSRIVSSADPAALALLEQRTAAALGQQIRIESLLLERLRTMSF